jgi:putative chitinase
MNEQELRAVLEDFIRQLQAILLELDKEQVEDTFDVSVFFDGVRKPLFGKLTPTQVRGIEAKLKAFRGQGWPVSWAAYALATSYHETAKKMVPVKEGLSASEAWRKKNLRYYPWYGRGDVQLTWEANYKRADKELGLGGKLVNNLDLALDPDISAKIMIHGMSEGWFSGDARGRHTLERHLPNDVGTKAQFTQARRIINLMDKADLIAGYAIKFQDALKKAGY